MEGGLELAVELDTDGHRPFPVQVRAERKGAAWRVLEGRTNPAAAWRHPWLEVRFDPGPEGARLDEAEQVALFERLGREVLGPGSYVMLSCDGHPESLAQLTADVPPACTWLGWLLWRAGARWYKWWYFPEGWREGNEKIQGNVPTDEDHAAKRTRQRLDELKAFLETGLAERFPDSAERAQRLLDAHG